MSAYYADDHLTVYQGDCRAVLAELPAESVHCVVTSPPYWGLRDYGDPGQLGLEPTPEEYVANMVAVFRPVSRVLRADGTVWLNLGDSYAVTRAGAAYGWTNGQTSTRDAETMAAYKSPGLPPGLKPKDLVGIPWRVAFALQADGWYLRSDIIWAKPNPMPESVTDRPTKAHEYLFLLSKSARYFYDADAVREADAGLPSGNGFVGRMGGQRQTAVDGGIGSPELFVPGAGRNLRSVWSIATEPYPGAHFATFPRKLVEPCIKAGTSERGVCPECGAPWVRMVERGGVTVPAAQRHAYREDGSPVSGANDYDPYHEGRGHDRKISRIGVDEAMRRETTGWRTSCAHAADPVPAIVLDPFAGSGTVGLVAQSLSRRAILIDLSADYLMQAMARNAQTPLGLGA